MSGLWSESPVPATRMKRKAPWLVMFEDGRFARRTSATFAVQWTVREQNERPSFAHVNYDGHEVAQVTYGGFWHVNSNENIEGTAALREAVDRYFDTH